MVGRVNGDQIGIAKRIFTNELCEILSGFGYEFFSRFVSGYVSPIPLNIGLAMKKVRSQKGPGLH
jgi:hypothetical protein